MAILKEIAEKSGVSIRTVTRALKGSKDINEETRNRVVSIAREMNYRPNFAAKSLKTKKTSVIGIIRHQNTADPENRRIAAISELLSNQGYSTLQGLYRSEEVREELVDRFQGMCDAIIFCPSGRIEPESVYEVLKEQNYPFMLIDPAPSLLKKEYPSVIIDREKGITEAIISVADSRPSRIALLTPLMPLVNRLEGFKEGLKKIGQPFYEEAIVLCTAPIPTTVQHEYYSAMQAGYLAALNHPAVGTDFKVLVCYNDAMALGVLQGLYEKGVKIPETVAVIGFDNAIYGTHSFVPLSTIAQPIEEPAQFAVNNLLDFLGQGKELKSQSFPTRFIKRHSS